MNSKMGGQKNSSNKILFIVSNTSVPLIWKSIIDELHDCDTLVINVDTWQYTREVERELVGLDLPFYTIESMDLSAIKKCYEIYQPTVVVVGNDDNSLCRMFVRLANFEGIPTLMVQDGIYYKGRKYKQSSNTRKIRDFVWYLFQVPHKIMNFVKKEKRLTWRKKVKVTLFELRHGRKWHRQGGGRYPGTGECLKMAVFGDATKDLLVSEGVAPDRIIVTGNPKFDKLFRARESGFKKKICEKWHIPVDHNIILLATQFNVEVKIWTLQQREKFVLAIASSVAKLPDTNLIIKVHPPQEDEKNYIEIAKGITPQPIVCKFDPIDELISSSEIIITTESTIGLEAMALGKPVIIVDLFSGLGVSSFYDNSGAIHVTEEQEMFPTIKNILYNQYQGSSLPESVRTFLYEQAYLQDGMASKRIAQIIKDLVNYNKRKSPNIILS